MEHGEEYVRPSSGEVEQGLRVVLSLGDLLVVVGPRCRGAQGSERGEEERPFELLVSLRDGCSPRIEDPEPRVLSASPA